MEGTGIFDLDQVRLRAKEQMHEERRTDPGVRLTAVQHRVARDLGYSTWPALVRDLERFDPLEDPSGLDWRRIRTVTVVCVVTDAAAEGGVRFVLHQRDQRWVVPTGHRGDDEDVWDESVLRIPLQTMGFRRQATHPFAVDRDRRHVVFWVDGGPYDGTRLAAPDVPWWTGTAAETVDRLRDQGDGALAALVQGAAASRASMSHERRAADLHRTLVGAYLRAETPQGGSGFGGSEAEWRDGRGVLLDALDPDRDRLTFLDQACANGHLAVSLAQWAAELGTTMEPYGADIAPELVERARLAHPALAGHFFIGDALTWRHPEGMRFDLVHLLLDVVVDELRGDLLRHQLEHVVAPGGRLLVSQYGVIAETESAEAVVVRHGFEVAGRTGRPIRSGRPRGFPSVWIAAPSLPTGPDGIIAWVPTSPKTPAWTDDLRGRVEELIEEYREALRSSLDGLSEDEARARLVPSKTTLLGLLKHVTYVEGIWFDQAVTGRETKEIGVASSPDRSFTLTEADTKKSILEAHRRRCELSRETMAARDFGQTVDGRGGHTVWALHVQVLRELAQHAGHADILREQILAARTDQE